MHNKVIAYKEEVNISKDIKPSYEESLLMVYIYMLGYELNINPKVYKIEKENSIWVYYEKACYAVENFFDEFGISAGLISNKYPLSIYGIINDNESASLVSYYDLSDSKIILMKKNVSGKDFAEMTDICVKIEVINSDLLDSFYQIINNLDYRKSYIAVDRAKFPEHMFNNMDEEDKNTFYKYIKLDNPYENEAFIDSLSIEQRKELWKLFLKDKLSPIDFDYAFKRYKENSLFSLFEWELALRLALSDLRISVEYNDNNFKIIDKNNKRLYFDYSSDNSAEKLFLKILFPINTFK
ncbi:hypothetical protein [uncultured Anaerofustis sp.]|uniref:hypothetical protein n=1 Tax=uncultured Anaerofustis sp. TaxID=904996 RepID=UPI0025E70A75|nr:hypothetical protein [uncultured Anaerofustis sp.]